MNIVLWIVSCLLAVAFLAAGFVKLTHARRHETRLIIINVVLLLLAAFVAWGRFGPYAF